MRVCDHVVDCGDFSDEANCTYDKCRDGEINCTNKHCVSEKFQCDGVDDCGDNTDEIGCSKYICEIITK